jgi:hypothetical protein
MRIRRQLRLLQAWAALTTLLFGTLSVAAFRQSSKTRFAEIDVERINIVEPDGKLRLVISNRPRSIGPIYQGRPFGYPGGGRPGLIFFNDEGTENGGLTFTGRRREDGSYAASTGMSFDQFNQDEVLTLRYSDDNGRKTTGITIADRDERDIFELTRVYLGRDPSKSAVLNLSDPNGKPRLRLRVDSLGNASLEFLDANGAVTAKLPGN